MRSADGRKSKKHEYHSFAAVTQHFQEIFHCRIGLLTDVSFHVLFHRYTTEHNPETFWFPIRTLDFWFGSRRKICRWQKSDDVTHVIT